LGWRLFRRRRFLRRRSGMRRSKGWRRRRRKWRASEAAMAPWRGG